MHPLDILNSIRLQHNTDATEKEIFESFLARVIRDDRAIREIAFPWFKENFKRAEVVSTSAGEREIRPVPAPTKRGDTVSHPAPPRPTIAPEQWKREKAAIAEWEAKVDAALTMSQRMPNGEQLQDCDAGYVRKLGGVFTALVKGLPDNVRVGSKRTNDDLQNVCKRYKLEAVV